MNKREREREREKERKKERERDLKNRKTRILMAFSFFRKVRLTTSSNVG